MLPAINVLHYISINLLYTHSFSFKILLFFLFLVSQMDKDNSLCHTLKFPMILLKTTEKQVRCDSSFL